MKNDEEALPVERQRRILLVDDYEDARTVWSEYFEHLGFAVTTAANGREGVERAREEKPDVVIMDIAMPVMDGMEALRHLREDPETMRIPVIACTGQLRGAGLDGAREAGFAAVLIKPVPLDEMTRTVERALRVGGTR